MVTYPHPTRVQGTSLSAWYFDGTLGEWKPGKTRTIFWARQGSRITVSDDPVDAKAKSVSLDVDGRLWWCVQSYQCVRLDKPRTACSAWMLSPLVATTATLAVDWLEPDRTPLVIVEAPLVCMAGHMREYEFQHHTLVHPIMHARPCIFRSLLAEGGQHLASRRLERWLDLLVVGAQRASTAIDGLEHVDLPGSAYTRPVSVG